MNQEVLVERLFESLVNGDRAGARAVVQQSIAQKVTAESLLTEVFWPTHEMIERLFKADQMTTIAYHLSTRLLRMLVDQTAGLLSLGTPNGKTVFAACGPSQGEELACQMACDLLESQGFEVTFAGGGIPGDELLAQVQERHPSYLVLFASAASDLPDIRSVIDSLREIAACPETTIVVGGGVFNRAEGLAEEIGAHLSVGSPSELVEMLLDGQTAADFERAPAAPAKAGKSRGRRAA